MLKTRIKASRITNLTDARYFAAREVAWLDFCLDPGAPEFVSPQQLHAIKEWVEGPAIVGSFGLQSAEEIATQASYLDLDAVQVGPFADISSIRRAISVPIMQEMIVENLEQPVSWSEDADYVVLDFSKNGFSWDDLQKATTFSPDRLAEWCEQHRILLALDFRPEQAEQILDQIAPHGLSVSGGEEEKVGYKSFDELDEVLDVLEVEE